MIHLDDSNVYGIDNENDNDNVNLPSPISLQLVNSNSRSNPLIQNDIVTNNNRIVNDMKYDMVTMQENMRNLSQKLDSNFIRFEQCLERLTNVVDDSCRDSFSLRNKIREELGFLHTKIQSLTPVKDIDDDNDSRDDGIDDSWILADDLNTSTREVQRDPRPVRAEPISAHPIITRRVQDLQREFE